MENRKKFYSIVLTSTALILFLILVSSTASAASAQSASPTITETRITTNPSNSVNPVIYGNSIVWQDDRNGNWDIYIQDLSTKKQTHTTNKSNQVKPDIDGSKVVWEDERNGGHDVYLQDLSTKKQTRITISGKARNPKIYGNRIVWMDGRNGGSLDESDWPVGNWDIYMYDLSTRKETQVTTNKSKQRDPDIYGNRIVWWQELIDGNYYETDIYMHDLSTKKETRIPKGGYQNYIPSIYANKIVWTSEDEASNYNIAMFDISTSTKTLIPTGYYGTAGGPTIYKDKIVWTDGRQAFGSGDTDVYMYDLSTSTEIQITTNNSSQGNPSIYGDRIVWQDERNENQNDMTNFDIYMATLKYLPTAAFSATPISGKVPLKVQFTDKSTGSPTSWKWNFGDGKYSTAKNPKHTYSKAGKYTVSLTAKNSNGNNTKTVSKYITVSKK